MLSFWPSDAVLLTVQALCVLLPAAGLPAWAARRAGRAWALIPPLSLVLVIAAIAVLPGVADGLTWLALLACPPLAAAALGWAMRGAWPPLALLAAPLLALAWTEQGTLLGDGCAAVITALSCVTLGRLIAGVTPLTWLKVAIVAMAVIDAYLVFSRKLEQPNATLNAAAPAPGLPQLQSASFGNAVIGYGDFFVAGVFGAIVAREGAPNWAAAGLTFGCCFLFDLLFLTTDTLPATVPVAVALLLYEAARPRGAEGVATSSAAASPPGPR